MGWASDEDIKPVGWDSCHQPSGFAVKGKPEPEEPDYHEPAAKLALLLRDGANLEDLGRTKAPN